MAAIYQAVGDRLPWAYADQSPTTVDRLRIDRLTIYCGDKMLAPYGPTHYWFDKQTNYVFAGSALHNGNPNAHLCDQGQYMDTLTGRNQVRPGFEPTTRSLWSLSVQRCSPCRQLPAKSDGSLYWRLCKINVLPLAGTWTPSQRISP
jgi:hypothetical protein